MPGCTDFLTSRDIIICTLFPEGQSSWQPWLLCLQEEGVAVFQKRPLDQPTRWEAWAALGAPQGAGALITPYPMHLEPPRYELLACPASLEGLVASTHPSSR